MNVYRKNNLSLASFMVLLMTIYCLPAAAQLVELNRTATSDGAVNAGDIHDFVVYGNATETQAGISSTSIVYVDEDNILDFESFFRFGGTLELLIKKSANITLNLVKADIVISELMWGLDTANSNNIERQWIEFYNTTRQPITIPSNDDLGLLFTPFNDIERDALTHGSTDYLVLDTVSNLHLVRWDLPGQNGRVLDTSTGTLNSPVNYVVSAYRKINYNKVETSATREGAAERYPERFV